MRTRVASLIPDAARAADIGTFPIVAYRPQQAAMLPASIGGMAPLRNIDPTAPRVPLEERTGTTFRDVQM